MPGQLHGHELIQHLFPHCPPKDAETADKLDAIREDFMVLAHGLTNETAVTPEQEEAIRVTHKAMEAWITAVVLYQ